MKPCPECGGERAFVSTNVRRNTGLSGNILFTQENRSPSLFIFGKKSNISSSQALACTKCGYTVFYATEPANLIPDQ